eukprot:282561-Hanusia_phi.AAC.2
MNDVCETKSGAAASYYAKKMLNPDFYMKERERLKQYKKNKYENDPEFRKRELERTLANYYKRKAAKMSVIQ